MNFFKKTVSIILLVFLLAGVASCTKNDNNKETSSVETESSEPNKPYEPWGTYQNGVLTENEPDYNGDVKTIEKDGDGNLIYTDYPNGFKIKLPEHMQIEPDFSISQASVSFKNSEVKLRISKERTGYNFIEFQEGYNGQHMENDDYLKNNKIEELRDKYCQKYNLTTQEYAGKKYEGYGKIGEYLTKFNYLKRTPTRKTDDSMMCYAYVNISIGNGVFYTFHFNVTDFEKYNSFIQSVLDSFTVIESKGINIGNAKYEPVLPNWNEETKTLYNRLKEQKGVAWGLFSPYSDQDYFHVDEIEQAIDYKFPIMMMYRELTAAFPLEELRRAYDERGQITELTLHLLSGGNGSNYDTNNTFGIIDGKYDKNIKEWAKGLKEFGHPVLLRCSNEMNSTWCKYSGVLLLCDPDLYIKMWRHVFDIFEQEGVQNAIWIFNPYDGNYPPVNWNDMIAYYPGNKYVQMIGLTAYSSGTYKQYETFRTFEQCYASLVEKNRKYFTAFPWIIGEFGCSSIGGDKEQWIKDMFKYLPQYPEIKAAVWFSYADYDTRYNREKIPARPLWLEEKEEYLKAFAEGVKSDYAIKSLLK
jgi:mannan endo-1,4-beta-mannosidase